MERGRASSERRADLLASSALAGVGCCGANGVVLGESGRGMEVDERWTRVLGGRTWMEVLCDDLCEMQGGKGPMSVDCGYVWW